MRIKISMNKTIHFDMANDLEEIERLHGKISAFAAPLGINDKTIFQINLALDEIITNIIRYAYSEAENPPITVDMTVSDNGVKIEIIDFGKPFNPIGIEPPNLDASIEARPVGGLGLHLVKSIMDTIDYHRTGNANHLILNKHIPERI